MNLIGLQQAFDRADKHRAAAAAYLLHLYIFNLQQKSIFDICCLACIGKTSLSTKLVIGRVCSLNDNLLPAG